MTMRLGKAEIDRQIFTKDLGNDASFKVWPQF